MLLNLKRLVKRWMSSSVLLAAKTRVGNYALSEALNQVMGTQWSVTHNKTQLNFTVPNRINRYRVDSFSYKKPETRDARLD